MLKRKGTILRRSSEERNSGKRTCPALASQALSCRASESRDRALSASEILGPDRVRSPGLSGPGPSLIRVAFGDSV